MAETSKEFDLVFEGGGAKGTVFVGALEEFEDRKLTIRRLVGTSAGAITAALLAAGCKAKDFLRFAKETVDGKPDGEPMFGTFMDIPEAEVFTKSDIENSLTQRMFEAIDIPFVPGWVEKRLDRKIIGLMMKVDAYREIFSFIERGGLYAGERFRTWIGKKIGEKIAEKRGEKLGEQGYGELSLEGFHQETKCDLSLVASDTTGRECLVLNHRTAPDCPIDWAVRMSMSIPFVWQEVRWLSEWGTYLGRDISGHSIVDGGVLSNFPLELLVSDDKDVQEVMGDTDPKAAGTLGFLIDENLEVAEAGSEEEESADPKAEGLLGDPQRLKTVKRIMRLINTMTEAHDKPIIEAYAKLVCRLPAKGYGTTEFKMKPDRRDALIKAGRVAMGKYFDER